MNNALTPYFAVGKSVADLMHPFCEVVIHDLENGIIAAIFNPMSGRVAGDPSHVTEVGDQETFAPYIKTEVDGRRTKSTTAIIRNARGRAIGLLCTNFSLDSFDPLMRFGQCDASLPEELFRDDWPEKIAHSIHSYLKEKHYCLETLTLEQRRAVVHHLQTMGAFQAKNAADIIGRILHVSRATIYKDLKDVIASF